MKHLYANFAKLSFLLGLIVFSNTFYSQVTVTNNQTVAWYIQNVLLGANVTVSNITYNGSAANANVAQVSVGQFNNPAQQIGLPAGMIMATGNATLAAQTNTGGGTSLGSAGNQPAGNDPQLQTILGSTTTQYDKCIVEFDFVFHYGDYS
jgi:large repetitive protein